MKKRDGLTPVGWRQSRSELASRLAETVSVGIDVGFAFALGSGKEKGRAFLRRDAALCSPTAMGALCARGRGVKPSKPTPTPSTSPTGYSLCISTSCSLLFLMTRAASVAQVVRDGFDGRKMHSAHGRMPDAGTKRSVEDATRPGSHHGEATEGENCET